MDTISDSDKHEKEKARGRDKYKRLYSVDVIGSQPQRHYANKNTRQDFIKAGYNLTDKEVHHWNYNFKNQGFILSKRFHSLVHKKLTFDDSTQVFYYNGQLLDTQEKHQSALVDIASTIDKKYGIDITMPFVSI